MMNVGSDDEADAPKRPEAREWKSAGGVYRSIDDEKVEPRRRLSMLAEVLRSLAEFRAK